MAGKIITLRFTSEDEAIINRILEFYPALRGNRSAAIRMALEKWGSLRNWEKTNNSRKRDKEQHHD